MPQKTILLDNNTMALISWKGDFHGLSVSQKRAIIAIFANKQDLLYGKKIIMPDQQIIIIKVANSELEAWHNGKELISKLMAGQTDYFQHTVSILFSFGVINIGGILFFLNIFAAIVGGIYIAMAIWAKNSQKKTPFWIAGGVSFLGLLSGNFISFAAPVLWYYLYKGITAKPIDYTDGEKVMKENTPLDYF